MKYVKLLSNLRLLDVLFIGLCDKKTYTKHQMSVLCFVLTSIQITGEGLKIQGARR